MRAVFIGEAMLEMSKQGVASDAPWQLVYGGDTLNTAVHMARTGINTSYITALGSDHLSAAMKESWAGEGINVSHVLTHPTRIAGLYAITTDDCGERSFSYWRSESAARAMFECEGIATALDHAAHADLLVYSLISLAILPAADRERLIDLAHKARDSGANIAFDGNYRPRLWQSADEARAVRDKAIASATIGLPTLEDEIALSGVASADDVAAHWHSLGCQEVIVKLGALGCRLPDGTISAPDKTLIPVDTSGAGDAFNAGYLAKRLGGATPEEAARHGHRISGWTIMQRGAIPAKDWVVYS